MISLYEALRIKLNEWRKGGYSHPEYSSIAEILEWASDPEGSGSRRPFMGTIVLVGMTTDEEDESFKKGKVKRHCCLARG